MGPDCPWVRADKSITWSPDGVLAKDRRLAFTPTADGMAVEFTGQGRLDPILGGVIVSWNESPKAVVSPTGFEPVFPD